MSVRSASKAKQDEKSFGHRVGTLRETLIDAVSDDDLKEITGAVVRLAKAGELPAIKLLLAYLIGTPGPAPDPDRLAAVTAINEADRLEAEERQRQNEPLSFGSDD